MNPLNTIALHSIQQQQKSGHIRFVSVMMNVPMDTICNFAYPNIATLYA